MKIKKKVALILIIVLLIFISAIILYFTLYDKGMETWVLTQLDRKATVGASKTFDISATPEDNVQAIVTCTRRVGSDDYFSIEITGTGKMKDWTSFYNTDYYSYLDQQGGWFWTVDEITIGSGITHIGNYAFSSSDIEADITIPNTVTSIGKFAFRDSSKLTNIEVDANNSNYSSIDGVLFNKDKTTLIRYPGGKTDTDYEIPNGVTSIGDYAFCECSSLINVTFPETLTTIGNDAFYDCSSLTNVTFPETLTTIGDWAFYHSALTNVTFPESLTTIGDYAFRYCDSLTNVIFSEGLTTIGDYAFDSCNSLTNVTFPESLTTIGDYAFEYGELNSIKFCSVPTSIGRTSIYRSVKIIISKDIINLGIGENKENNSIWESFNSEDCYIEVEEGNPTYSNDENGVLFNKNKTEIIWYGRKDKEYTIPNGVTSIGEHAFYNSVLTNLTFPGSLTTIDDYAFASNDSLINVTFLEGLTTIGDGAFFGCESLTNVILPEGLTTIGDRAFSFCDSLTNVTFSEGLTTIGDYAFERCNSLTNVTFPGSLTTIGDGAFYYCDSLTNVTLPEGLTTIGTDAFWNCTSLTNVNIPSSVTSIGEFAFRDCRELTNIEVDANNSNYSSIDGVLFNKEKTTLIFYPVGKTDTDYEIPNGVTSIGDYAFYYCDSLTNVTLPEGLTTIGDSAFCNCTSLTNVTFPEGLTTIGTDAFWNCTSLTNVTFPETLTTISDWAFFDCDSLTTVTLPESLTTIGMGTFGLCDSLTNVTLQGKEKTIGPGAFGLDDNLDTVSILTTVNTDGEIFTSSDIKKLIIQDGAEINIDSGILERVNIDTMIIAQSVTKDFQVNSANTIYYKTGTVGERIAKRDALVAIPDDEAPRITLGRDTTKRGVDSVTITINATDDITGLHAKAYSFDGGKTWQEENTKKYTENVSNGQVQVRDIVGNVATASFNISNIVELEQSWDISKVENSGQVWADLYVGGFLRIRGQGEMKDFIHIESTPWKDSHVKRVEIQEGVTNIGESIFSSEYRLKEVTIADSVKTIGSMAFSYCIALSDITLPSNLVSIGSYAFEGCNQITNVTIPESVKTIEEGAFSYCQKLTDINVESNNTAYSSIDGVLFDKNVTKLIIYPYAKTLTEYSVPDTVKTIGISAFTGAEKLTKINLPEGLTTIEENAFMGCSGITEIMLPSTLTTIEEYAFSDCYNLDNIEIPGGVKTINSNVFQTCINLKSVTLLDGVTTIKDYAFSNCNLYEIYLPASLNKISYLAFSGCSELEYINVSENNSNYTSEDGVLYNKDQTVLIIYPSGKQNESYAVKEGVIGIYEYAFIQCNNLSTIAIPSTVLEIEDSAFYQCRILEKVIIPDQVTYIGEYAFDDCNEEVKIYCRSNSYAQTYAEDYNIAYVIDNDSPTIVSVEGNPTEETWDPVTLTINAQDEGAGLVGKVYSFDGGKTWQEENTHTFESNGIITIQVRDALGNVSQTQKVSITQINSNVSRIGTWDISATENDHVEAALYSNKVLVISGTGKMMEGRKVLF